jgi:hypothetical protein
VGVASIDDDNRQGSLLLFLYMLNKNIDMEFLYEVAAGSFHDCQSWVGSSDGFGFRSEISSVGVSESVISLWVEFLLHPIQTRHIVIASCVG